MMNRILIAAAALFAAFAVRAESLLDIVPKGSTDRSVTLTIYDSTDGTPENGVVFNTSGIALWYRREGAAVTDITEVTLAALTTAHTDGGFIYVRDGEYRLDLPDAAFATGANYVDIGGTVTGMIVKGGRVRLVDVNVEDSVRAGLTALPNAAAAASGGLFTRGTGAGQINQDANGRIDVNIAAISTDGTAADNLEAYTDNSSSMPVNAVQISGDSAVADRIEAAWDGTCGQYPEFGILRGAGCTAQAYTAGTPSLTLDASAAFGDNALAGATVMICSSTLGYCQAASIASNVGTTDIATLAAALPVAATGTITYTIYGTAPASGGVSAAAVADAVWDEDMTAHQTQGSAGQVIGDSAADTDSIWSLANTNLNATVSSRLAPTVAGRTLDVTATGGAGIDWANVEAPTTTLNLSGTTISTTQAITSVSGSVGSVTGAVGSVTGNVGGNVAGTVASVVGNVGGNVTGSVGSVTGAVGSVTGNVGGTVNGLTVTAQGNVQTAAAAALTAYDPPTQAEMDARTLVAGSYATATNLATVDTVADAIKVTTDKLDTALELDGSVYRYTVNALENAPAGGGGGGSTDWSVSEKEQIRHRLGIDGTANAPSATPSLASASSLAALTSTIGVGGAGLTSIPYNASWSASVRSAVGLATANLDTQFTAIPTGVLSGLIDDQNSVSLRCAMAAVTAILAGDFTTSGSTTTFEEATGAETRAVSTVSTGTRNVTITCPSY